MSSIKEQLKTLKVIPVIAIDKAEDIIPRSSYRLALTQIPLKRAKKSALISYRV